MFTILTDNIFKLWGLSFAKSALYLSDGTVASIPLHNVYTLDVRNAIGTAKLTRERCFPFINKRVGRIKCTILRVLETPV